jgi:two-component system response regulator PilR (NtrC family)
LHDHDWPGNVRELENVIQRQVALARGPLIEAIELVTVGSSTRLRESSELNSKPIAEVVTSSDGAGTIMLAEEGCQLEQYLEEAERSLILQALERTGGNQTRAAQLLGVSYRQLRYRSKKLGVRSRIVSDAP